VSRASWLKAFALTAVLLGFGGAGSAVAQDWTDYLHWPYVPPQVPGNGFEYKSLYDGYYVYPRTQRIVPQIQGPYYRNFYGGYRIFGIRIPQSVGIPLPNNLYDFSLERRWHEGHHFTLDVF